MSEFVRSEVPFENYYIIHRVIYVKLKIQFTPTVLTKREAMKKLILILCISFSWNVSAQDPTFTQFYANPLYLNPAFAGSHGCPRFALNYRNEWPQL
ncbi:MAG: hypothetical protein RIT43_48, partial [Bacteroidota bacterium]